MKNVNCVATEQTEINKRIIKKEREIAEFVLDLNRVLFELNELHAKAKRGSVNVIEVVPLFPQETLDAMYNFKTKNIASNKTIKTENNVSLNEENSQLMQ